MNLKSTDMVQFGMLVRALVEQARASGALVFNSENWAEWEQPAIRQAIEQAYLLKQEAQATTCQ
jgi:hypothetical protein